MITVQNETIPYHEGMTVAEALKMAGESVVPTTLVVMEGLVLPYDQLHQTTITDGTKLELLPIVSGG